MRIKNYFSVVFIFLTFYCSTAQPPRDSLQLCFKIKWNENNLELQKKYRSQNDSIQLATFKFYVSAIAIEFTDKSTFIQKKSYHLINIENPRSLRIPVCTAANKIVKNVMFTIGIDSLTSVSGALSGDLDAANGMYWAWQSGFINFKIEGKSSSCKTLKNKFQFHIGGYLSPNYALRKVQLKPSDQLVENNTLMIQFDVAKLFNQIDLATTNSVMIPGNEALKIADKVSKLFYLE